MTTAERLRKLLDEMAQDCDGDVNLMAKAIKSYTDGCPDDEVVSQTERVIDAFEDVLTTLRITMYKDGLLTVPRGS